MGASSRHIICTDLYKGNYKITVFNEDLWGLEGRTLNLVCQGIANLHRVSNQFFKWHFPVGNYKVWEALGSRSSNVGFRWEPI